MLLGWITLTLNPPSFHLFNKGSQKNKVNDNYWAFMDIRSFPRPMKTCGIDYLDLLLSSFRVIDYRDSGGLVGTFNGIQTKVWLNGDTLVVLKLTVDLLICFPSFHIATSRFSALNFLKDSGC